MEASETSIRTREFLRRQMPVAKKWAYFDHASVAPLPAVAAEAAARWANTAMHEGDTQWLDWNRRIESIRTRAATLVAADVAEIALVPNTTTGINVIAEGLPWRNGDNVVTAANEFPTNQYPWLNLNGRGVEVRRVEPIHGVIDPNAIAEACDERTRLVSLSWVGYASGYRIDPAEMAQVAHDHGALFLLDAIQGLGVFPLDVRDSEIDFFAADGHKWLLGPEGAGLLYIRREHLEQLRPTGVGWNSVEHSLDFNKIELTLRPSAARFEGGSQNMIGFHALGASLDLLAECGLSRNASLFAELVLQITAHAADRLEAMGAVICSPRDDSHRGGIVSFELPDKDPQQVRKTCLQSNVALACRDGRLRISPHAYNNEEDVERLIFAISTKRL